MLTKVIRHGFVYWEVPKAQPTPKPATPQKPTLAELQAQAPAFQSTGAEPANETLAPVGNEGSATRTAARAGHPRASVLSVSSVPSVVIPKATPAQKLTLAKRGRKPTAPTITTGRIAAALSVAAIARIQAGAMQVFQITAEEFRDSNSRQAVWARIASICLCIEKLGDRGADRSAIAAAHLRDPAVVTRAPQKFFKWKRQIPAFAQQVQALKTQLVQPQAQN